MRNVNLSNALKRQLQLTSILESAFREILLHASPDSVAQVVVKNPYLNMKVCCTKRLKASLLSFDHLAERLVGILISDENILLSQCTFYLTTFTPISVGGRRFGKTTTRTRDTLSFSEQALKWKTIYDPFDDYLQSHHPEASSDASFVGSTLHIAA